MLACQRFIATLLTVWALWVAGACRPPGTSRLRPPILLVAVDGFEWEVLLPLVRKGEVPTLAGLMQRGAYGLLETTRPTFSPIIWTSIATGKSADQHGIRGFVKTQSNHGGRRLFNNYDRRTKAFWNILSDYGKKVAVVGWWMTYPVEPVNGLMVAQVNTLDQADRKQGRAILKGRLIDDLERQVHPPERLGPVLAINRRVARDLPQLNREIFGSIVHPMSPLTERLWENTQWALRADATYVEIAAQIAREDWDLLAVYLGGADVVAHRFWRHMQPESFENPPPPAEVQAFGMLIPDYYRYIDRSIGRILENLPAATTVIVVSDHGMHARGRSRRFHPENIPKRIQSAGHGDAPAGVLLAAGPRIVRLERPDRSIPLAREHLASLGSIFDVTPTLLELLDVPVGEDMKGRVLTEWLVDGVSRAGSVTSHDTPEWLAARRKLDPQHPGPDAERMEQLKALGYID